MKKSILVMAVAFAVLMAAMLSTGCVQETAGSSSSSPSEGTPQVSMAEQHAGIPVTTPDDRPDGKGNATGDTSPAGPAGMQVNGLAPSDRPAGGTPPSGMQMNATPPSDMPPGGNPPSGMPGGANPPSDMPLDPRSGTGA